MGALSCAVWPIGLGARPKAHSRASDGVELTEETMTQKFKRGSRVHIADEMPPSMRHFQHGIDAIVEYTYAQKAKHDRRYSQSGDFKTYSLLLLDAEGKPTGPVAWYEEEQLSLLSEDIHTGLDIIEQYYFPQ